MKVTELFAYLRTRNAAEAIEFYKRAFDATEKFRLVEPSGRVGHAELDIGGFTVLLSDEYPEFDIKSPQSIGGTGVGIHIHVDDCDAVMKKAVAAGATVIREAADHFWGERGGVVRDPFGHEWMIGHHLEDISPEEMQRRFTAMCEGQQ